MFLLVDFFTASVPFIFFFSLETYPTKKILYPKEKRKDIEEIGTVLSLSYRAQTIGSDNYIEEIGTVLSLSYRAQTIGSDNWVLELPTSELAWTAYPNSLYSTSIK